MPSGSDPTGVQRFSLATNAERVCAEIMLIKDPKRDGDSTQSHRALERAERVHVQKLYFLFFHSLIVRMSGFWP
jgi:hypothetical protein